MPCWEDLAQIGCRSPRRSTAPSPMGAMSDASKSASEADGENQTTVYNSTKVPIYRGSHHARGGSKRPKMSFKKPIPCGAALGVWTSENFGGPLGSVEVGWWPNVLHINSIISCHIQYRWCLYPAKRCLSHQSNPARPQFTVHIEAGQELRVRWVSGAQEKNVCEQSLVHSCE